MAKPRITSELFRELLFNELNKESSHSSSKSNFYEHLRTTYSIAKQRSLQLYDIYYHDTPALLIFPYGKSVSIKSTLPVSILSLSIRQSPKKRREKTRLS